MLCQDIQLFFIFITSKLRKKFISNNKDSRTAEFLQEYINILEDNNNEMDSAEVLEFYDNRYSNIKYKFGDLGL